MSTSQAVPRSALRSGALHLHLSGESCPVCDQPIPHDRFDEIKARIEARQSAKAAAITSQLQEQFAREKADAVEFARQEAAAGLDAQVARVREDERRAAETAANEKLAEAARSNQEAQKGLQAQIEQAQAAKTAAEESGNLLKAQLDQARHDSAAAIEKMKEEAHANAASIREEAQKQAEAAVKEKITVLERTWRQSATDLQARITETENAKAAAVQVSADLEIRLNQMRADSEAAIEQIKQGAEAKVIVARQEATAAAEAALRERIATAEQAKAEAEAKALAAQGESHSLLEAQKAESEQLLKEQREALEAATTAAVNVEKSAAFERQLKLEAKLADVQRTLDNKTAEELGEGAELDLYEVLKGEFEGDKIERINKGQPGADILHIVIHNGKECGKIIYDSKDRNAWRNDFVVKLATDQMAAKADHAILSTRKFPAGTRHLHVQDGIIIAAPSRVAALVQIIREHIVRTHTLRLSDEARVQKTATLYSFITSQRFADLFSRIDTHAGDLLEMQVKEKRAHEAVWKKQGEMLRSVQKVGADIRNEIEMIIGTADAAELAANE